MRVAAAWTLLAIYVAFAAGAIALILLQDASTDALGGVGFAGFAGVGALIALRQPRNAVGWLLLIIAIAFTGVETGQVYVEEPSNPLRVPVAWSASLLGYAWFSLAVIFLPLLFPHGRLPSPRWRPVLWLGTLALMLAAASAGLTPGPIELADRTTIENPFGIEGGLPELFGSAYVVVGTIAVILVVASVVVRFRHARGAERQQLKWFAYVGVLAAACLTVAVVFSKVVGEDQGYSGLATVAWLCGLALVAFGVPAATGIAILRHRLYDVDVVIRRTLVYGALTATLGATYLALALLAGLAVGRSSVAIAVSTLAVAVLSRPALARIQAVVDRRFYRRRYDTTRTLEAFGARLRDEIDLEAVGAELRGAVRETVQPAHVSLWLRS